MQTPACEGRVLTLHDGLCFNMDGRAEHLLLSKVIASSEIINGTAASSVPTLAGGLSCTPYLQKLRTMQTNTSTSGQYLATTQNWAFSLDNTCQASEGMDNSLCITGRMCISLQLLLVNKSLHDQVGTTWRIWTA